MEPAIPGQQGLLGKQPKDCRVLVVGKHRNDRLQRASAWPGFDLSTGRQRPTDKTNPSYRSRHGTFIIDEALKYFIWIKHIQDLEAEPFQRLHCCLVPFLLIKNPFNGPPHAHGILWRNIYTVLTWGRPCAKKNKLAVHLRRRGEGKKNPSAEDSLHGRPLSHRQRTHWMVCLGMIIHALLSKQDNADKRQPAYLLKAVLSEERKADYAKSSKKAWIRVGSFWRGL